MTDYTLLLEKVRELGMDSKWAISFVHEMKEDEEYFPISEESKKKWALERGFFPGRIELYGLTEDNYRNYLPDYHYAMMHPYNNHFLKWLDKTTLKYILNSNGCEDMMPEYYVYVENDLCGGHWTYLMDCPADIPKDRDFLWNLLQQKKILAMKPNSGTSGGLGFIKLEIRGDTIYENNQIIDMARFEEIRDTMRNYIITEYAHQHHELAKIWSDSECTLRVILCKNPSNDRYTPATWTCVVSFARFGTNVGDGASNLTAGGVGVGFDYETGAFYDEAIRYKKFTKDGQCLMDRHPDTGVVWKGIVLPNWQFVRSKIDQLCRHMASLDYMGLDIIITETGMKICEINSLPSIHYNQVICGPALSKPGVKNFFIHKGLESINSMDFYKAYMECQRED